MYEYLMALRRRLVQMDPDWDEWTILYAELVKISHVDRGLFEHTVIYSIRVDWGEL